MTSSEMSSGIVVDIILLALLALFANVEGFLGLEGRLLGLDADPDALDGRVHVVPVALTLVGAAESDGAVGAGERSLSLGVRWEAWDELLLGGDGSRGGFRVRLGGLG